MFLLSCPVINFILFYYSLFNFIICFSVVCFCSHFLIVNIVYFHLFVIVVVFYFPILKFDFVYIFLFCNFLCLHLILVSFLFVIVYLHFSIVNIFFNCFHCLF